MDLRNFLFTVISSALVASVVSFWLHKRYEERKYKLLLLDDILGYRYQATDNFKPDSDEFIHALNRVVLVFNSHKDVLEAIRQYKKKPDLDNLLTLIKKMSGALNIKYDEINDNFLLEPFVFNKLYNNKSQ